MRIELLDSLNQLVESSAVIAGTCDEIKAKQAPELVRYIETCESHLSRVVSSYEMAISNYMAKYGVPDHVIDGNIEYADIDEAEEIISDTRLLNRLSMPAPTGFTALVSCKVKQGDYISFCNSARVLKNYYLGLKEQTESYLAHKYTELPTAREIYLRECIYAKANTSNDEKEWKTYPISAQKRSDEIFIGNILYDLDTTEGVEDFVSVNMKDAPIMEVPFAYSGKEPFALFISYKGNATAGNSPIENLLRNIIYQILRGMGPYTFNITYIDPFRSGALLGEINTELYDARDSNAYWLNPELYDGYFQLLNVASTGDQIRDEFNKLEEEITKINAVKGELSFAEANKGLIDSNDAILESERGLIMQKFVIIENIHNFFSQATFDVLCKLIENYKKCGISIIFTSSRNIGEELDEYEQKILREIATHSRVDHLKISEEKYGAVAGRHFSIIRAKMPDGESDARLFQFMPNASAIMHKNFISSVCSYYHPSMNFDTDYFSRMPVEEEWGKYRSDSYIEFPVGINARNQVSYVRIGNAENAHGMLSGMTGCGKSSFLHTIINSIISRYSPKDVQILLSDYKSMEFRRYITDTPPHIRHIGISKKREYTYSFLDSLYREYERRLKLFGKITELSEYRAIHGADSLPRLFVIIDEFHEMSNHVKDDPEYRTKLTNILRESRAVGITLLLADQTCAVGLKGLEEDALRQISLRMSMRQEEYSEYNAIFNINNARDVIPSQSVYEVVVRRNRKTKDTKGNIINVKNFEHNKTLYVSPGQRDFIAQKSIDCYGAAVNPKVVLTAERILVDWREIETYESTHPLRRGYPIYPGVPLKGGLGLQVPIVPDYNNNLICLACNEKISRDMFINVLESVMRIQGSEIYVMANPYDILFMDVESKLNELRCKLQVQVLTNTEDICRTIFEQTNALKQRVKKVSNAPVFIFWIGLSELMRDMEHFKDKRPSGEVTENVKTDHLLDQLFELMNELDNHPALSVLGTSADDNMAMDSDARTRQEDDEEMEESPYLYDARSDIGQLFKDGSRYSVFNMAFFSSFAQIDNIKPIRMESFKHRLANSIAMNDSIDIVGNSQNNKDLDGKPLAKDVAIYYDCISATHFMPYALPGSTADEDLKESVF